MREFIGPTSHAYEVAFVPGECMRVAGTSNTAAYLWSLDSSDPTVMEWNENAWGQPVFEASPDGKWLVAGPTEALRCWDLSKLSPEKMAVGTNRGILVSAAFSPDGLPIATGTMDGPIRV
jgi:WD40 repeat protein